MKETALLFDYEKAPKFERSLEPFAVSASFEESLFALGFVFEEKKRQVFTKEEKKRGPGICSPKSTARTRQTVPTVR